LAVGGWRLAIGCWLLAVGRWLLAVGRWRLAVGEVSFVPLFHRNRMFGGGWREVIEKREIKKRFALEKE
jgi:hypothetical protein